MKLHTIPDELFKPLRLLVQDGIAARGRYAWSSNHDQTPFSYWYMTIAGTTDANTENMEMQLLQGTKSSAGGRYAMETWNLVKRLHGGEGCALLRAIAYVHEWNAAPYPHISIGGRAGDRTVVLYLNKEWKDEWQGETVLYTQPDGTGFDPKLAAPQIENIVAPIPNRLLSFPADQRHEVRPSTGTYASRVSLVFRLRPVASGA